MKNAKSLYTLAEWESMCQNGSGIEQEGNMFPRYIPIECPNILRFRDKMETPKMCRAKMKDDKQVFVFRNALKRMIYCDVCGYVGTRSVGKQEANE